MLSASLRYLRIRLRIRLMHETSAVKMINYLEDTLTIKRLEKGD